MKPAASPATVSQPACSQTTPVMVIARSASGWRNTNRISQAINRPSWTRTTIQAGVR